jgi:hypothetical protein
MSASLSSKADKSSVLNEGRAEISSIWDIFDMKTQEWRDRLAAAIENSGKSARRVSLDSGNGPGYVHSILKEGKDPTVDNLMKVCGAVPVSVTKILFDFEISPETEEIVSSLESNPSQRDGILKILAKK